MSIRIELLDYNHNDAERNLIDVNTGSVGSGFTVDGKFGATWSSAGITAATTFLSNIQNTNLVVGKEYFVSFEISGYSGTGDMGLSTSSGVSSSARLAGNGTYSETFTATDSGQIDLFARNTNNGTFTSLKIFRTDAINWGQSVAGHLELTRHDESPFALTYQISDVKNITSTSGHYSKTFKVPATKHNNCLLKNLFIPNMTFDNDVTGLKPCRIVFDGLNSIEGLLQVTGAGGYGQNPSYYNCVFYGNNMSWGSLISEKLLKDVNWGGNGESIPYNKSTITATWADEDCTSSDSFLVYPITSYGDYNPNGIEHSIQLLGTGSENGHSATSNSYYGTSTSGSYGTPPPVADWRPAIFVKDTLDQIFKDAGGYSIKSDFMDTSTFKKLVWLLPNFKYNNPDERYNRFGFESEFASDASLPADEVLGNNLTNIPAQDHNYQYDEEPIEFGTDGGANGFSILTTDASNEVVYTNSAGNYSYVQVKEYGYYNVRVTDFNIEVSNPLIDLGQTGSFSTPDTTPLEAAYVKRFSLAVQVRTQGETNWANRLRAELNTSDYEEVVGGETYDFVFSSNTTLGNLTGTLTFDPIEESIWLNKDDLIRLTLKVQWERKSCALGVCNADYKFTSTPKPFGARFDLAFNPLPVEYGQTYSLKDVINPDYKQKDFIKGVVHAFNLKLSTDSNSKQVILEPFNDFYKTFKDAVDWTEKLDRSREITDKFLKTDVKRNLIFKYKQDSNDKNAEYFSNQYFEDIMDIYPYKEELDSIFEAGDSIFENPFFAGTLNNQDLDTYNPFNIFNSLYSNPVTAYSACLWQEQYNAGSSPRPEKGYDFQPRLLYWNKLSPNVTAAGYNRVAEVQTWSTERKLIVANSNQTTGNYLGGIFPQATSYDPESTSCPNLCYGNIWVQNFDASNNTFADAVTQKGLFDTYYKKMLEMLKQKPRLRTVSVDLKVGDVLNLDFQKLVYIDGVYWRLNKVIDYQPNSNSPTKVELLEWFQLGVSASQTPRFSGGSQSGTRLIGYSNNTSLYTNTNPNQGS